MIGALMVYGSQQWPSIQKMDLDDMHAAYHAVMLVKRRENEASEEHRKKLEAEAEERRRRNDRG